jgi:hypothetical protein
MINHVVTNKEGDEEKQIIVPLPKFDIGAAYKQLGGWRLARRRRRDHG